MGKEVSEYDKAAYQRIRNNVNDFIKYQAGVIDSHNTKLLDIAPQNHGGAKLFFVKSQIVTADINDQSDADFIIDICENNEQTIPPETFDVIICTEVLEHTLNPFLAVEEIYRLLKWGGTLLMSTPFDFRIHGPLPDCWRFTEHGIKALLKDFKIVEIKALENEARFLMPVHYTTVAKKEKA